MLPAARIGDLTGHGATVVAGSPQVLIGRSPAARMGDATLCPQHGPGKILLGSPSVLIGGVPAARATDACLCLDVIPDVVAAGLVTVLIGIGSSA